MRRAQDFDYELDVPVFTCHCTRQAAGHRQIRPHDAQVREAVMVADAVMQANGDSGNVSSALEIAMVNVAVSPCLPKPGIWRDDDS